MKSRRALQSALFLALSRTSSSLLLSIYMKRLPLEIVSLVPMPTYMGEDAENMQVIPIDFHSSMCTEAIAQQIKSWDRVIGVITDREVVYITNGGSHPLLADALGVEVRVCFEMSNNPLSVGTNCSQFNVLSINLSDVGQDELSHIFDFFQISRKQFPSSERILKGGTYDLSGISQSRNWSNVMSNFTTVEFMMANGKMLWATLDSITPERLYILMNEGMPSLSARKRFYVLDTKSDPPRIASGFSHTDAVRELGYINEWIMYLRNFTLEEIKGGIREDYREPTMVVRNSFESECDHERVIKDMKTLAQLMLSYGFPDSYHLVFYIRDAVSTVSNKICHTLRTILREDSTYLLHTQEEN